MRRNARANREVAVPVSFFASLRRALDDGAGAGSAVHALHKAGYEAGLRSSPALHAEAGGDALGATQQEFWSRLEAYFGKRGWGTLTHEAVHAGLGVLTSGDWAEAEETDQGDFDPEGSCSYSTGFLSGLLSQVAGGPVAVLEVDCRTRGAASCRFAFGSEAVIHELYGRLVEGADLDAAIAAL